MVSVGVVDCGFYSSLEFFKVRGFKEMGSEVQGSRLGPRGFEEAEAAPALHPRHDSSTRASCGISMNPSERYAMLAAGFRS